MNFVHSDKNMSTPPQTHSAHSWVLQRSSCNIAPAENPMSPTTTPNINELSNKFHVLRWKYVHPSTDLPSTFLSSTRSSCNIAPTENPMSPMTTPNVNESNKFCVLKQKYVKLTTIINGSLEVAVMHISKGEFLALIFVLWENHARRTRKVQIIKMQKVERLDPGLNLPVLMPFNPLKGLDDPGGELFVCNGLPQGYVVCSASTHFVPQNKVRFLYTNSML